MTSQTQIGNSFKLRRILLVCGILAPIVWVCTDIIASMLYPGYSYISQATSELFAIGAPTSSLVVPLFTLFDILLLGFAIGTWLSAGQNRPLRITALMLVGLAVSGLSLWPFFPMHMRGTEVTFTDTMHLTIAAISIVPGLLSVGLGMISLGKRFKYFSIGTIIGLLVPGILAFLYAPQVATNQSTPLLGLNERIAQYINALWIFVLAVLLLRRQSKSQPSAKHLANQDK